ncbi:MAG: DUF58 domain-containing protein [Candidatus Sumerlaeaceae bacterium]|nr:DUF58 domain-containing protein [Candidatus Sumerlaeaceae bacterium]
MAQPRAQSAHGGLPLYEWLFLAGLFLTVGALLASPVVGGLGIALMALAGFQGSRLTRLDQALRIKRLHAPRCQEGDTIAIRLRIENLAGRRFLLVGISDRFAAGGGRRVKGLVSEIPPNAVVELAYRQPCDFRRGIFVLGPVEVTFTDELGLFQRTIPYHIYTDLLVCPKPVKLMELKLLGEGTLPHVGSELLRREGRSEQFAGVRRYREGDAIRFVHWPTSARANALYVKEFDRNTVTEVNVVVDMYETGLAGIGGQTSCEQRLRVTCALVGTAIAKHHFVRVTAAQTAAKISRLGGGTKHLQYLMEWLAMLEPRGQGEIEGALLGQFSQLRRGSTLALVLSSTNIQLEKLCTIIRTLKARQIEILAAIIEDRSYYKLRAEQVAIFDQAMPLKQIERALRLAGCAVYTLDRGSDILTGMRQWHS